MLKYNKRRLTFAEVLSFDFTEVLLVFGTRPKAVEAGTVKLVGIHTKNIIKEAQKLLDDTIEYEKMSKAHNPYGDGKACQKILDFIKEKL